MKVFVVWVGLLWCWAFLECMREPTLRSVQAQASHGTASEEVPHGTLDGVNGTFTLNFQPLPFASLHLYRNGLRLHRGLDYTLGGQFFLNIIFSPACSVSCIPQPGDVLLVDYTY